MATAAPVPADASTGQHFNFERWSIPCCSVLGVPIRIHAMLPLVAVLAALGAAAAGAGLLGVIVALLVSGPLLFATVLVHEFGHVLAARRCGFVPDHILLWPLGGLAYISKDGITPKEQIFVSSMGPATHVPMILFWCGLMAVTHSGQVTLSMAGMWYSTHFVPIICVSLLVQNLSMLIFNLLVPCIPLDCSQILVSAMLLCGFDAVTAAKVMVIVSIPIIAILLGLGVWYWLSGSATASLTIMLAVWLGFQTWRLHRARVQGQLCYMPLFATAMQASASQGGDRGGGAVAGGGGFKPFGGQGNSSGFQPFGGQGVALGRSASNEVCIASAVALAINVALLMRISAPQG